MRVRHVLAHEGERLREIRLRSLATDPEAFGATFEGDASRPADWWERGARHSEQGVQRTFVVVDEEDRWLGMALVRADDESPGDAVINAMWIAPEARRQGMGRALLEACVEWALERRFRAVNLAVRIINAPARAAYASAGFEFVRAERDEHQLKRPLL
ncbi:GNAT family N-acetyltransferase [Solirubrobacter phytolaccae]|uniref:GNAT family N-acetyltransferase n=1 Tax=Solirubrobacter phytolaccae TaxID=1404360 RepID=A0A9X3NH41_9ACTN|nr:GNAT family N-acetyltransferase [Solirubrobacter phytolaccae]MDA0184830.1 GNAT family N-acetyltransferase [Solirubrobacter phytolaccae]